MDRYKTWTGVLFIVGAVLVFLPYNLLIINFSYPDILREPAGAILTQFHAGAGGLIFTWLAWWGIVASFIYFLAQTELLATVIPDFPVVPEAGFIGSTLWLLWLIALGIALVRTKPVARSRKIGLVSH